MKKIGLISRCDSDDVLDFVRELVTHLRSKAAVLIDMKTAEKIHEKGTPVAEMRKKGAEFVISIGGDGTVLRGIQKMNDPLPVLGINMGKIGFLVDVVPEEAIEVIDEVLSGFEIEERSRLSVRLNDEYLPPATNEVVVIVKSGVNIIVDGLDNFGSIDVDTDNLVIWTDNPLTNRLGESVQQQNDRLGTRDVERNVFSLGLTASDQFRLY